MLEGTLDPMLKGTQDLRNPFNFKNLFSWKRFVRILRDTRGFAGEEETFTKEQVDEAINNAVAAAKSGAGNFFEGFAPDIKGHPAVTRYKSVEELAKGHIELEKKIGMKGVILPAEGASDQIKNDFYKAIGRPDKPEEYANPVLDGLHEGVKTTTEQDLTQFKQKAHELGLSSKQFDEMYKWYLGLQSQRLSDYDAELKKERDEAATALRNKLGSKYEESLALASGIATKFGSPELAKEIGNSPGMIELLAKVAGLISEDKLQELGRSTLGMSPEEAKVEINKITDQIMKTDQADPIYKELLDKRTRLYKVAYPSGQPS